VATASPADADPADPADPANVPVGSEPRTSP
jgi:hypothetical protein